MKIKLVLIFLLTCGASVANELDSLTAICVTDSKICKTSLEQFVREYPKAVAGDYQAQRNVAFCFSNGCDGAVIKNRVQACAWRKVILSSGSPRVDSTDVDNHKVYCSNIDSVESASAIARAKSLMQQIYSRDLEKLLAQ